MAPITRRKAATMSDKERARELLPPRKGRKKSSKGLAGDYANVALLFLLYTLQGVPLGLSSSFDLILQEKSLSLEEQGVFNSVSWPYSLKLLWAPIVDSIFFQSIGRRKSWLVPCQLLIGVLLLIVPTHLDYLLGGEDASPKVYELTALFFLFYFLAATQDIAVDGWAVSMLARRNIGYASTCNAAGQMFGYILAFTGLLSLQSYKLCTLESFMFGWGVVFIITTLLVAVLKHEETVDERRARDLEDAYDSEDQSDDDDDHEGDIPVSISEAYYQMKQVLSLKSVQLLCVLLFTRAIAFSSSENLGPRMLVQKGLKKEHMATFTAFVTPLNMFLPGVLSSQVSDKPLTLFKKAYLPRVLIGIYSLFVVLFAPDFSESEQVPWSFYLALALGVLAQSVLSTAMFVAIMAFFAQIADPSIGGTYMTMLNTISNLGSKWPNQLVLFLVGKLTWQSCDKSGENCEVILDGFIPLSVLCFLYGVYWYFHYGAQLDRIQRMSTKEWRCGS